jgi:hypothetical protein
VVFAVMTCSNESCCARSAAGQPRVPVAERLAPPAGDRVEDLAPVVQAQRERRARP